MDAHHCREKAGTPKACLSDISALRGSKRERCWWMDSASSFKRTLSPLCTLSLDLSGWPGPPLRQEALCAGRPRWLVSDSAVPGRVAAAAASDTFQSSCSKPLPSGEANRGASVTAWGSDQIISTRLGKKTLRPLSSGGGGDGLRKPEPRLLSWLGRLALRQVQNDS